MFFIRETKNGVVLRIHVVPKSAKSEISGIQDDALKLKITAPPAEGQANEACIRFLSDTLGVRKSRITIVSGHKSRKKTIAIEGIGKKEIEDIIA